MIDGVARRLKLRLPMFGAPMFLVSGPDLVIGQCKAGIVGGFPALNARPAAQLDEWLHRITEELAAHDRDHPEAPAAAFAVNQIVAPSNDRLEADLELCVKWKVPVVITSLGGREAVERGADGLIAVCAGAGGATGSLSPFALVQEIRAWFDGPLALSGAIATGRGLLAAQAMGADFGYVGSAFIATREASAPELYKQMVLQARADDILNTKLFTGLPGNFLKASVARAGLDPDALPAVDGKRLDFGSEAADARPWRDIWGCGQGVGAVSSALSAAEFVARLAAEYEAARGDVAARLMRPVR